MGTLLLLLAVAGGISLLAWVGILLAPARPWDLRPVAEDELSPPEPSDWPAVAVFVPARNEAAYLPRTLPALLAQDYPGEWRAIVVDDRSEDGTGAVARRHASERLTVLSGAALRAGWVGKVWALEQALLAAGAGPSYVLLTDADVRHAPGSLRRLVAESEAADLALNSRMARLRCVSRAERLLIPPFLFFFNLLYPMRRANDPKDRLAAAAGGCILLRREVLERAGGLVSIRGEVIDDVNLARRIKALGEPIRLSVSRTNVESLREHDLGSVWRMVRRTAFDELRYSWWRLGLTVAGLVVLFGLPPALTVAGLVLAATSGLEWLAVAGPALAAWLVLAALFRPATRLFGLGPAWAATLPLAGVVYGAITIDSAVRHAAGGRSRW